MKANNKQVRVQKLTKFVINQQIDAIYEDIQTQIAQQLIAAMLLWQFESVLTTYLRQCFEDEIQRKLQRQMDRISEEIEDTI